MTSNKYHYCKKNLKCDLFETLSEAGTILNRLG
jgi:hypothetical protein